MLKTVDVSKHYKNGALRAVNGVTLEVRRGEFLGLLGESGCGKSTLSRLMVGLEKPDSGDVFLEGKNIGRCRGRALHELKRKLQLVFQDPYSSLDSRMSIFKIIEEPLTSHFKMSLKAREEKVCSLLQETGLAQGIKYAFPHELSGGQRQRVALARAIALEPEYLILDEPLASLDVSIQAQILNLLVDLKERYKSAYIFISHDLKAVRYLCDHIGVMYGGKIVEILPVSELTQAQHPYTRMLSSHKAGTAFFNVFFDSKEVHGTNKKGCGFAGCCPEAEDNCFYEEPVMRGSGRHRVACLKRRM